LDSRNAFDIQYSSNATINGVALQNPIINQAGQGAAKNGAIAATFVEPLIIPPLVYTEDWFRYSG